MESALMQRKTYWEKTGKQYNTMVKIFAPQAMQSALMQRKTYWYWESTARLV
jgi:hypothetical protein